MAYTEVNFKTKKALKEAIKEGKRIAVFQPNNLLDPEFNPGDTVYLEGPWGTHKWHAKGKLGPDGYLDKIT